jgi:hypothetical protein
MKEAIILSWKVKVFDCNAQLIKDYDILKGHYKDFVKKLKKKCFNKEEFSKAMDREMRFMFWSRCEWELIIELDKENHIWLTPWVGCSEPEKVSIDVTYDKEYDWQGFLKTHSLNQRNCLKIDVYDQLKYRWDEFITYLWTTRQKYERCWSPKFDE